ncbi:DUF5666 domain-containing protein [Amycolatopsis sp. GM8]|uniref:DUF5666 domain-containing protein n=1 Tax=Amycolatopsis sp. GM8 TaxID=2896530 RepID=UPI001F43BA9F|nr:DUF5666 domain-containing protein [Amycolatopsis sp. GM8]
MIRRTVLAAAGAALALTLAACGSSSGGTPAAPASQAPASGAAGARGPAASGTIAAVAPASIEVQNPSNGQVTVNYSSSTTFTDRVSGALSDVAVGTCVAVTGTGTPVAAKSVEISAADNGTCAIGGGGPGQRPQNGGGSGTARPSRPSGAPRPSGANDARGTFGKVTAVSGTGFTVEQDNRQTGATTSVQVTVDPTTTYQKTESANSSALKVGECAVATGQADDTGAVTAKTISLSQAGPNGCQGFGGRGRNGAGGGNGAGNGGGGNGTGGANGGGGGNSGGASSGGNSGGASAGGANSSGGTGAGGTAAGNGGSGVNGGGNG